MTVSELSGAIKRALEDGFGYVRLRGEISGYRGPHSSGHAYFALKDDKSKIDAVIWKGNFQRLRFKPEEGMEVIAQGKVTTYPGSSKYQIMIETLEPAGAGALMAILEQRKRKLAAEGLFAEERKRKLPFWPAVVGIVTSPTGAVIRDMLHGFNERFPAHVIVWPVRVQGEGSAAEVANAIRGFNRIEPGGRIPRPDVLIVARGGGSLEDLMAFNDEGVLRAVAACRIPLISAVGHETDTTLIDFVSDQRAPTPTAAAEMAIPALADLQADIAQKAARLGGALNRLTSDCRLRLSRAERGLPDLPGLLGGARQRLDDRAERLVMALPRLVERRRVALGVAAGRLPDLPSMVTAARERVRDRGVRLILALPGLVATRRSGLDLASQRLLSGLRQSVGLVHNRANRVLGRLTDAPLRASLREARARLDGTAARLESVSPLAGLGRGYVLVTDRTGLPVTSAAAVAPGARLGLKFADGAVKVTADGGKVPSRQGSLGF
jgi:exodeoxyribonuclease VII large subunit